MDTVFLSTTTFNDVFKSSFMDKVTSFSIVDTILAMGVAFALGLFIFLIYKKTFSGVMYSASFGVSLIAMALVTTFIILAITSNVVLSLGMVGALSIVRFRTAVKEPLDISFLFWSISVGIVVGAGLIPLAVIGTILIGVTMLVFVNKKSTDNPYILVISCVNDTAEKAALTSVKDSVKKHVVKSKTVSKNGIELTVEIRLKDMTTEFVNKISDLNGVENVVLVSYNGDYMS
ncbi:Uncharacterized membrane protein YhiD, involved in acid resistance [Anaerosporobacter mobilis DSM 15930]|uniref:Uncharacterized membrane protein YhiD, involved in acid resistance n=1 Tax=Anaerosporobacter mobilis DSM 15930 TaxID=1120996 RepID=A0A1M7M302_9FIRM|nr:DUF4956 domain-containing protein [Anaerosporobacter mobilis]SHM84988.1 Uncharacterized membrane protein YhiD, involved in acid resistance [Anaerosporobacter mobilis DSM 15930]